jgi:hypothetical protein
VITYPAFLQQRRSAWVPVIKDAFADPPYITRALRDAEAFATRLAAELRGYGDSIGAARLERAVATHSLWLIQQAIEWGNLEKILQDLTQPAMRAGYVAGAVSGAAALRSEGITFRFNAIDPHAVEYAKRASGLLITEVMDEQKAVVSAVIAQSQTGALTWQEAAARIKQTIGLTERQATALERYRQEVTAEGRASAQVSRMVEKYRKQLLTARATLIARHETLTATNEGRLQAMREAIRQGGMPMNRTVRKWITAHDERVCPICGPMDGEEVRADSPWSVEIPGTKSKPATTVECWVPQEAHVQCLLPHMRVAGSFIAGLCGWYDGPIYEIETAKGYRLTVTANHPIATMQGLVPAYAISHGDDILTDSAPIWGALPFGDGDNDQAPVPIKNVVEALRTHGTSSAKVGRLDLHGDARWINGEIEIVGSNRNRVIDSDPHTTQFSSEYILHGGTVQQPLIRHLSRSQFLSEGANSSSRSGPRMSALTLDKRTVEFQALPFQEFRIGSSSDGYPTLDEAARQGGAAYAEFRRQLLHGSAAQITSDCVIHVNQSSYSGHVYDLQSSNGFIIAEGIVISNCRCSFVTLVKNEPVE